MFLESPMKRTTLIVGIASLVAVLNAAIAVYANGTLGFKTENGETNQVTMFITKYIGECTGTSTPSTKGWFFSEVPEIASGKKLKIKFQNTGVSGGDGEITRSFKENNVSKSLNFRPFEGFRILEGMNTINFDLIEQDNVLKQGRLTVLGVYRVKTEQRNASKQVKNICLSGDSPCSDPGYEVTRICPSGSVLSRQRFRGDYQNSGPSGSSGSSYGPL
jgi:hypothetical protein